MNEEHRVLCHALGLNRKKSPNRNYYFDEPDALVPNELVKKAMMVKSHPMDDCGGMCCYQVTNFGKEIAMKAAAKAEKSE